jgi:carbon-monoxide dehydrogenase large subunit
MLTSWVRQGYVAKIKMGIDKEGKILGIKNTFYFDTGISAEYGANPVRSAGYTSTGCYHIPNVWTDSYAVYTNKPFGGAYRGFGLPELMSVLETVIDIAAHKIGMDPVEFRLKNLLEPGLQTCTGMPMQNHALREIIEKVVDKVGINKEEEPRRPGWKRGKGLALAIKAPAMPADASSSAIVKVLGDGTVEILAATMDMGQGTYTSFAQMASEELGIPVEKIRCIYPDTSCHPYDWQTVASRSCWSMGMAVKRAAVDAREKIISLFSQYWQVSPESIVIEHGIVKCRSAGKAEPLDKRIQNGFKMPDGYFHGGPIIGTGSFVPPDVIDPDIETGQSPKSVVHFTVGAVGIDVEVDPTTGRVEVNRVSSGYDVGKAISPMNVQGQIEGGTVQGISAGLMEGMYYDEKGRLLTPDFTDYKIATIKDIPEEIDSFWEETPEELSPYGNRGVGEHSMISPAPAIGNALFNALGVRIHTYPFSRERVYKAVQMSKTSEEDLWEYPYVQEQNYKKAKKEWF